MGNFNRTVSLESPPLPSRSKAISADSRVYRSHAHGYGRKSQYARS
jgi:hypothetical protein